MLRNMGHQVVTASSGLEAVAHFRSHHHEIDLAIIDMLMPEMDGLMCFQALRHIDPAVRALLCSGYACDGRAQHLLDQGMLGFIQKPYRLDQLAAAVDDALSRDEPRPE
jgi:two-component system, cell cycle sensor histidine kinase and response regulator CckA